MIFITTEDSLLKKNHPRGENVLPRERKKFKQSDLNSGENSHNLMQEVHNLQCTSAFEEKGKLSHKMIKGDGQS
jgi:hypothetical protein